MDESKKITCVKVQPLSEELVMFARFMEEYYGYAGMETCPVRVTPDGKKLFMFVEADKLSESAWKELTSRYSLLSLEVMGS